MEIEVAEQIHKFVTVVADAASGRSGLVERPQLLWLESSLGQKQRLQRMSFPDGSTYSEDGFGTPASNCFLSLLLGVSDENTTLASPTGFEPVLPP